MRNQLEHLSRLQEIDDQLSALERSKGDYPERIEQLQEELSEMLGKQTSDDQRRAELGKDKRRLERLLKDRNAHLEKEQVRLSQVKTNKEWDAIQKEIDAAKTEIREAEDELLGVIEQVEELNNTSDAETEELRNWQTQATGSSAFTTASSRASRGPRWSRSSGAPAGAATPASLPRC
jgi:predicted  nucleic acid-binding Zn-ribbon protein